MDNPGDAIWYIGARGYTSSNYSITATVGSQCPDLNNCSGHGNCVAPNSCVCFEGWTKNDCSQAYQTIIAGTPINNLNLERDHWMLFEFNVQNRNDFTVMVNQTSSSTDIDLYLRYGATPSLFEFDYRDSGVEQNFRITVTEPRLGLWWIGAYAYAGGVFSIQIPNIVSSCPNQCSGSSHGTCSSSGCSCKSGFTGSACEEMASALTPGVSVQGYVAADAWNYYHISADSSDNLVLSVNQTSSTADSDLYIKAGSKPTRISFDYAHFGFEQNYQLILNDPGTDTWWIGVFGYKEATYTLRPTVSTACPGSPPCSGSDKGTCINGVCQCKPGYSGPTCSLSDNSISNGQTLSGSIQGGQNWIYYTLAVPQPTTYLAFDLKEKNTNGVLWLFVSKGVQAPSLRVYDYGDHNTGTSVHRIAVPLNSAQSGSWTIGVFSNPFSFPEQTLNYTLSAWASPF